MRRAHIYSHLCSLIVTSFAIHNLSESTLLIIKVTRQKKNIVCASCGFHNILEITFPTVSVWDVG